MDFITFLSDHPQYTGAILVVLMLLESSPVIGLLIPGTFILPVLGAMSASTGDSFWYLYICVVMGAFAGDMLGFWLGRLGAHKWQPQILNNHRQHLALRAKQLIKKHGLLAIFIGRFIWIVHPAIPGAAGLLGIKLYRFIPVDLLAVFFWVLFYMGGGQLLTGLWLNRTFEFIEILAIVTAILFLLWGARYLIYYFSQRDHHVN